MPSINKTPNIGLSQWQGNEYIKRQDVVNDNAAIDTAIGNRTIDDTKIPSSDNYTSLSMLLSWLGNMIKSITGKGNWRTAPVKSIEQLNNNIVTHEAEITSLQNEVQNTLARASVSLNNTAPVQSFTADVAGPVDVEFRAPDMIANSVVNGNFANGTTGWNAINSSITASNNTLSNTGNGGFANPYFKTSNTIMASVHGKKIYSKARVRVTNANCLSISFALRYGTTNFPTAAYGNPQINNPVQNQWYNVSSIVALNSSDTGFSSDCIVLTQHSYADSATANGKVMEVQQTMAVDLTAIFGSGNEPDIAWCDANISYVNGIQPLVNPMVKVSGKNLVRNGNCEESIGYYGLSNYTGISTFSVSNGRFKVVTGNSNTDYVFQFIYVKPGTNYYINYNGSTDANIRIYEVVNMATLSFGSILKDGPGLFTTGSKNIVAILLGSRIGSGGGTFIFDSISMTEGSTTTAYEPYKGSSIVMPGEFCKIGSYADKVKLENGVAKKLAAVKKVVLDGNFTWTFHSDGTGYKRILSGADISNYVNDIAVMVKYDGKQMINNLTGNAIDAFAINPAYYPLIIGIADTDSGWGETYTPMVSEMQALMNGWKMNNGTFGTAYNGSGTKTWTAWNATSNTGAVTIVPTTKAPGWTSWATLWYALASPVEEIINIIGSIGCFEGQNTISVETGLVYEKANPEVSGVTYYINVSNSASQLSKKVQKIIGIYKNEVQDIQNWTIDTTSVSKYGRERANIPQSNFDLTAEYYVLYQMLPEEYNNQQISLTTYYPGNLRGAHNALTETVTNIGKELSDVWIELLPLADKEIAMASIANLTTETTTDLKNKVNEILNIW